ncbi:hypothetical protein [Pseudorhodobacter sp.]|uniref:hypothetical protein n=1 Tax=Pseudorhodobacter sp. TaxID=1934400 RepID=UPI00264711FB|nr:hypothetical protein [Pseudorhodobacter sp.]MDN5787557.1 hypothetical protein [Pseudorhodobacter sp.]
MKQIINMVINQIIRRLVNTGINKGVSMFAGKGKPAAELTPAERKQAASARDTVKRARQTARITRRLGR